jgi:hypothetical protein
MNPRAIVAALIHRFLQKNMHFPRQIDFCPSITRSNNNQRWPSCDDVSRIFVESSDEARRNIGISQRLENWCTVQDKNENSWIVVAGWPASRSSCTIGNVTRSKKSMLGLIVQFQAFSNLCRLPIVLVRQLAV